MKYVYLFLLITGFSACKSSSGIADNELRGKLVISALCSHYVVEIISGKVDASKVAAEWKDDNRNQTYKQSFSVANKCSFGQLGLSEGDEFTFTIDDNKPNETCAVCMAYYPTPTQALNIKNIKKIQP